MTIFKMDAYLCFTLPYIKQCNIEQYMRHPDTNCKINNRLLEKMRIQLNNITHFTWSYFLFTLYKFGDNIEQLRELRNLFVTCENLIKFYEENEYTWLVKSSTETYFLRDMVTILYDYRHIDIDNSESDEYDDDSDKHENNLKMLSIFSKRINEMNIQFNDVKKALAALDRRTYL